MDNIFERVLACVDASTTPPLGALRRIVRDHGLDESEVQALYNNNDWAGLSVLIHGVEQLNAN